jgi:hypothetical protein
VLQTDPETGATKIAGEETDSVVTGFAKLHVIELVALAGLVSGTYSLILVTGWTVNLMSVCVMLLAPVTTMQMIKLRNLGGFRAQHNLLRQSVSNLHEQNNALHRSIQELATQVDKLKKIETNLSRTAQRSGQSVTKMVDLVQRNGTVQSQVLDQLQAQVTQQMLSAVLQSDQDHDWVVDPAEVSVLIQRLKLVPGIKFNEQAFRNFVAADQGQLTLTDVCDILRHLDEEKERKLRRAAGTTTTTTTTKANKGEPHVFEFRPRDLLPQKKNWLGLPSPR